MQWMGGGLLAAAVALSAGSVIELNHEAIRYSRTAAQDAITRLNKPLQWDEQFGYLPAVLAALDVPVESQILVFSKTSFQASRITADHPRALYFNDTVSVGYVPGGDVVELAARDPKQGFVFYTLDQEKQANPQFVRRDDACLQCHVASATSHVPGLLIRSVYPEPSGMPLYQAGGFITDHRSPLTQRWGGWYVTGKHGGMRHMGNAVVRDRNNPGQLDTAESLNRTDLPGVVKRELYLTPHSDIVALMVAEHQFHGLNLIGRVNFETRLALHHRQLMTNLMGQLSPETAASVKRRIEQPCEELLEYLLFLDEAPLEGPVEGTSGFQKRFGAKGGLRELDLRTRLFRAPLSFLVESESYLALPAEARSFLTQRLRDAASGRLTGGKYAKLSAERRASLAATLAKAGY
jgi:hypothetical protein